MTWWWIGNLVLFAVVIPLVIFFGNRLLRPVREIKAYAADLEALQAGLDGLRGRAPDPTAGAGGGRPTG